MEEMQVQIISEMRVHEKGIVPIYADEENEHFVNARELHAFLDVGRDFSNWIKDRIAKYRFVEGEDYSPVLANRVGDGVGKPKTEYLLTLDTAKEIAMTENNERGREVRRYFIEVEKRVRRMLSSPRLLEEMKAELKDAIKEELRNELSLPIRENVISEFPQPIRVIGDLVVRLYKGIPVVSSFDLALTFNRKHFRIVCDIRNTYCGDTLYEHEELFHRCDIVPVDGRREEHFFITVNGLDLLFRRWGGWGPAWKRRELLENFKRAEKDHLGLSDDWGEPMASKKYDLCVKTGEYEKDGQTKGRYESVGAVFTDDKGPFILLKRTFNPAGITPKEGSDSIKVYCFKPKG